MHRLRNFACLCAMPLQSCLTLCNPMDCILQTPLSMGFSKQEYCSGLPCPPPGDLTDPGIEPTALTSNLYWQAGSLPLVPPGKPRYNFTPIVCCAELLTRVRLFVTPWTIARLAPLSLGILQARILEWVAIPPPGDLSCPGIKPRSRAFQADSLPSEPPGKLLLIYLL